MTDLMPSKRNELVETHLTYARALAAEIVRQSSCGVVVDEWSAEAWGQAVANVDAQGLPLRRKAREVYLSRYSEQAWINGIEDVYRGAIERRGT